MTDSPEEGEADSDLETSQNHSADTDDALADALGVPANPREIYLEEASVFRPIITGDIFRDVLVPGNSNEDTGFDLTMVLAHPSTMRKGPALEPHARAAPIVPMNGLSKKKWPRAGNFNCFPLPQLAEVAADNGFEVDSAGWGTLLEYGAPVDTAILDVEKRIACLSPSGIELLLQRLAHADTRFPVKLATIRKVFQSKLEEIELLEDWNEAFVPTAQKSGLSLRDALFSEARRFESAIEPVRPMLADPRTAAEATRSVRLALRNRRQQDFASA